MTEQLEIQPDAEPLSRFLMTMGFVLVLALLAPMWDDPSLEKMLQQEEYDEHWAPIVKQLSALPPDKDNSEQISVQVYEGAAKQGIIPLFDFHKISISTMIVTYVKKEQYAQFIFLQDNLLDISDPRNMNMLRSMVLYAQQSAPSKGLLEVK